MSEYDYEPFSEDGKVVCQICGKSFLVISPRHLGTHNITYSEYKLRFPDAPLSCEEFNARGKYGKEKRIFVEDELKKFDEPIVEQNEIKEDDDIPEHDVNPTIDEEIDFEQVLETVKPKSLDICDTSKDAVLDCLRAFFTNIKKDYMIQIFGPNNALEFEYITDFADPVLKINVEFPNAFWHNRMAYVDASRDEKLKGYGWKIIKINSRAPNPSNIIKVIQSL